MDDNQFIFLLTAEGEIARLVASFIYEAFEKRKSIAQDVIVFTPPTSTAQRTRTRIIKKPVRLIDELFGQR